MTRSRWFWVVFFVALGFLLPFLWTLLTE